MRLIGSFLKLKVAPAYAGWYPESFPSHYPHRMASNFPHGSAMDNLFIHIRSLLQILDAEMYELMHPEGDLSHLYFCYR